MEGGTPIGLLLALTRVLEPEIPRIDLQNKPK